MQNPFDDLIPGARGASGPRGGGPKGPTARRSRELTMESTGESIESANVNQAQGRTALAVDAAVVDADIRKRRADAAVAELQQKEKERESPRDGALSVVPGASETKTRLGLGFGPAVMAEENMRAEERWRPTRPGFVAARRNPFQSSPGALAAKLLEMIPMSGVLGGEVFQRYQQAAKSWESSFLPIFSGQAVTEGEARRQIKARLPAPDDSPSVLTRKSIERRMLSNGAADLMGQARPFPEVGALYPDPKKGVTGIRPTNAGQVPATGAAPAKGTVVVKAPTSKIRADWALIPAAKRPAARKYLESMGYDTSELR